MATGKRRFYLNLLGATVVAFWLLMMGLLVKKLSFRDATADENHETNAPVVDSFQREWKEIYLKGRKVGYSVNLIKPFEDGYLIRDEIYLKLNLMGMGKSVYTVTQSSVDREFILKNFYFKMTSGVVSYDISGRVEGGQLLIKTGKGRGQRTQRIGLKEPPVLNSGMDYLFKTMKMKVGESLKVPFFDPSTMTQRPALFRVIARERLKINRIQYDAFRVETEMWGVPMTFWLDGTGTVLKEEGFMGLVTVKSSAANAPMDIEGGEDFYETVAVPVDKKLPDPGRLSYLKLKVTGLDGAEIKKGGWDSPRQSSGGGILEITREKENFKVSYSLPYDRSDREMAPFLSPEFNIESDADEIVEKAREIAGNDKNPASVSRKMMRWVYENLDKKPVLSIPSGLEVLRTRMGDCNEHATLLTALLRAAGIPARLSIGLVYNRDRFFYHAWTEAFVGEWITMDATLNQMPADVGHILLVYGNLDRQVEIMGLIGKLKFEVLDFGYY